MRKKSVQYCVLYTSIEEHSVRKPSYPVTLRIHTVKFEERDVNMLTLTKKMSVSACLEKGVF